MPTIRIQVSKETLLLLRAKGIHRGRPYRQILEAFAADCAGSYESRGSDEREFAEAYVCRAFDPDPTPSERDADRRDRLIAQAQAENRRKHAECQSRLAP